MEDNFGLKIGVGGEKEFKKVLADINQSFKALGSENGRRSNGHCGHSRRRSRREARCIQ